MACAPGLGLDVRGCSVMAWKAMARVPFCVQCTESIDHLLLTYVFSGEIWFKTLRHYGWQGHAPTPGLPSRKATLKARRKAFDSLVAFVAHYRDVWIAAYAATTCGTRVGQND
jgi:hypothetical protein